MGLRLPVRKQDIGGFATELCEAPKKRAELNREGFMP